MTPPLRVLVLDHTGEPGGAELALVRALAAAPQDELSARVVLFGTGPLLDRLAAIGVGSEVLALTPRARLAGRAGVGRARSLLLVPSLLAFVLQLARRVRELRPDVVLTSSLKSDLLGWAAARLARVPVVWWVHDRIADDYLPARTARLFRWAAAHLPDAVIANSQATAVTLGATGRLRGIAHPGFAPAQLRTGGARRSAPQPPVVGLLGRISPTKGQLELVEAAALLHPTHPDVRFVCGGAALFGEDDYADQVRATIAERGLSEVVTLAGHVDDVAALLDGLTVMVHASPVPEPFGQVLVEAMVRGVPVVATDAGGVPEILRDPDTAGGSGSPEALGLLVPPGDVRALATAVGRLLDDPEAARRQAERAYASATRRFPAERTAQALIAVCRQVARPRGRPRAPRRGARSAAPR